MLPESTSQIALFAGLSPSAAESASVTGLILFAVIAIGFSFLCSIAEAVLLSVTPSYIATLGKRRKAAARRLQHLKENIDRPLAAILSLNTIAHTVGAAGVGAQAAGIWGNQAVGWASAVMTLFILVLSEIIPKTIGAIYWRRLAPETARLVGFLIIVLYPLVRLSDLLTHLIAGEKQNVVTREEVAAMAALGHAGGQLEERESRIVSNLFKLQSLSAKDVMTPRPVVLAFPEDITVAEALARRENLPVSRLPVYQGTIDHVTGFVLKTDILLAQAKGLPETPLLELKRSITAVTADASLSELMDVLLQEREHLALVVDEYGGTDGLVTMEDLIETLIGAEIVDEADSAADMQRLAREKWQQRAEALGLGVLGSDVGQESGKGTQPGQAPADSSPGQSSPPGPP